MTYLLRSVRLENFLSHAATELEFGRGVTVIVGENGAGKSSIVDAVYLALTGEARLRGPQQGNLVRRGVKRARVTVTLTDGQAREATVSYEIAAGQAAPHSYSKHARLVVKDGGRIMVKAASSKEVPSRVAEELGLNPATAREVVGHAIVLRQGGLQGLAELLASRKEDEKAKLLGRLLGVEAYREAGERLAGSYTYNYEGYHVDARQSTAKNLARLASQAAEEARRMEAQAALAERELEQVRARLAQAKDELARVAGAGERLAALRAKRVALEERLAGLEGKVRELEREAERLRVEIRRLEPVAAEAGRLKGLATLYPTASRALELEARLRELRALRDEAEAAAAGLERYLGGRSTLEKLGELNGLVASLRSEAERLAKLEALLSERLDAALRALKRIEGEAARAARLLDVEPPEAEGAARLLEMLESKAAGLEEEASRLESEAARLEGEARASRERAGEAREAARLLRGGEARCPLCGSPLGPGAAESLRARLLGEAERLEAEASRLGREAERLKSEARAARAEAEGLRRAAARLRAALDAAPDPGEAERLKSELERARAEAKRVSRELSRAEGELDSLKAKVARLEEALAEAWRRASRTARTAGAAGYSVEGLEAAVARKDPEAALAALRGLLSRLREDVESLEDELASLEERLREATGAGGLAEAARAVLDAQSRLAAAAAAAERLRAARAELERVEGEMEAFRAEAAEAEAELERVEGEIARVEGEAEAEARLREEAARLDREAARLEGEARAHKERARRAREEAEKLGEAARRAEKLARLAELMRTVVPRALLRARLAVLEVLASEALARFNMDYNSVSFKVAEDGRILVTLTSRSGEDADPSGLSGGERIVFALAVAMALARLSAVRAGFMILDEPTAGLDEERRRVLVEVLRRMGGGIPQLIVVTHDEEVRNAADVVYRVSKRAGVSMVSKEDSEGV